MTEEKAEDIPEATLDETVTVWDDTVHISETPPESPIPPVKTP